MKPCLHHPALPSSEEDVAGRSPLCTCCEASTQSKFYLVERRTIAGKGLAYSTDCLEHLLNVPARCMSILPSAPRDFLEWLNDDTGLPADYDAFIPRAHFGRYIADRLEAARREARPNRKLLRHHAEVLDVTRNSDCAVVHLNGGTRIEVDFVVLALGNAPSRRLPFFPCAGTGPRFYESAWSPGALTVADPKVEVVLVGSGLTAVDALVGLRANGHRGIVRMISRRGLLPKRHLPFKKKTGHATSWKHGTLREMVREIRKRAVAAEAAGSNWCEVIDSLRRMTNQLWFSFTPDDRDRFYRHVKALLGCAPAPHGPCCSSRNRRCAADREFACACWPNPAHCGEPGHTAD